MADSKDAEPSNTLRNRRTTVEDAEDSDSAPVGATTATSITSGASSSTAGNRGTAKRDAEDRKKQDASQARRGQRQPSQLRNFIYSLLIASIGVLLKSAIEKFVLPSREIAIDQTVGLQGNCYKTACKLHSLP